MQSYQQNCLHLIWRKKARSLKVAGLLTISIEMVGTPKLSVGCCQANSLHNQHASGIVTQILRDGYPATNGSIKRFLSETLAGSFSFPQPLKVINLQSRKKQIPDFHFPKKQARYHKCPLRIFQSFSWCTTCFLEMSFLPPPQISTVFFLPIPKLP